MQTQQIHLTFDDGPHPEITPWILDFLKSVEVKATFFCVGQNILKYPEIFTRIRAEGHQVGNHTMQHQNSTQTNWSDYYKSVMECQKLIGNKLFRPPYGRLSAWRTRQLAKRFTIIMWSWLSYDYDQSVSLSTIMKSASSAIKPGDILVLHDNVKVGERVKTLLPALIEICQAKGLVFAAIEDESSF